MLRRIRKSSYTPHKQYKGQHRFEHWYKDNQIYFITARCHEKFPAFESEEAKKIFWDRFTFYAKKHQFTPAITSLLDNHYHTLGYAKNGEAIGEMMRQIHGSIATLVNKLLPEKHLPFFHDRRHHDYFDGCIRDEKQCRLAFRYVKMQSVRHGIVRDWMEYAHTRVNVELEALVKRAKQLRAFLEGVPYKRYEG